MVIISSGSEFAHILTYMKVKQIFGSQQNQFLSAFNAICIPYLHKCFLLCDENVYVGDCREQTDSRGE